MIRLVGLWLVGCALCVTPVAADEDLYDGPTAIKPLTVTPQPQHSAPPNMVCDFEHQCYPEKGGPAASAPAAPPAIVVKPIAPRPQNPDEPIVATWRDCMSRALQTYEQSQPPRPADGHGELSGGVGGAGWRGLRRGRTSGLVAGASRMGGRRNIGCGWWPIGSDADRDCAASGRRF